MLCAAGADVFACLKGDGSRPKACGGSLIPFSTHGPSSAMYIDIESGLKHSVSSIFDFDYCVP